MKYLEEAQLYIKDGQIVDNGKINNLIARNPELKK